LEYLVSKLVHQEGICGWLLLFQEFEFEVIVKLGREHVDLNNLSIIETVEDSTRIDNDLPNAHLFKIEYDPRELVMLTYLKFNMNLEN
jgi:hypothetical protein